MHIELKSKRDIENMGRIKEYYNSFEKIFKERQNKSLIQGGFYDKTQSQMIKEILSFIEKEQVICHHSWGINSKLIFQLDLLYFHFIVNQKQYVFGIGYQLQESTIKINCAKNPYMTSVPNEINKIIPIFKKNKNSIFSRFNSPKTHAYVSISKIIDNFNQYNINEQCAYLYELLLNSMDLINSIKKDIKNAGGKFFKYYAITNNGT
jgi:hypothetical protein